MKTVVAITYNEDAPEKVEMFPLSGVFDRDTLLLALVSAQYTLLKQVNHVALSEPPTEDDKTE